MANKNGHDDSGESEESKITRFPGARERAELERRLRAANDPVPRASEPVLNLPPVVKALCGAFLLIHAALYFMSDELANTIVGNFGFFAARYGGDMPLGWQGLVSPVTYMLLHGGWLHLSINVATLAAFGAGLEKTIGGKRLLALFFITGVIGAFAHFVVYPGSSTPLVGASGGISGLFGAVLVMAQQQGLMGDYRRLLPFVAVWIAISLFFGLFGMPGAEGQIAWTAHIGGFIAGILLYRPIVRSKIFR
jgi:membrane associated rhomboid family serine protease